MVGYKCGKDEVWLILVVEFELIIVFGMCEVMMCEVFVKGVLDGSIVDMVDW